MKKSSLLPVLLAAVVLVAACQKSTHAPSPDVRVVSRTSLPADPNDPAWSTVPVHVAPLVLQDMVEPRLIQASTAQVEVRAISDGSRVAFRLSWADGTKDDSVRPAHFSDACAVQLPAKVQTDVPAPQMGEAGKTVEITYWKASWQASVDGRKDTIKEVYPGAAVDHYPFEAASLPTDSDAQKEMALRYSPARALGNTMAGPRKKPVEDLIAEGPGSLTPAPAGTSDGKGLRTEKGWVVVLSRAMPAGLNSSGRSQVAFAVWEGSHEEAGARKMRTGWVPVVLEKKS
ncbi:MAG: hypothetical protein IT186_05570 [Acidobacteria bacterium]|nr:hypothetical protein [Acidobacteriota bacterium]MCK6681381.1 ethylbenzene dehydrogenase-related protein [Thermoanaerobaculia bacterium]